MDARTAAEIHDQRIAARDELHEVTTSLIAEFAGRVPAGTVIRCVAKAREQLLRAGVRAGLATATESSARNSLTTLGSPHGSVA